MNPQGSPTGAETSTETLPLTPEDVRRETIDQISVAQYGLNAMSSVPETYSRQLAAYNAAADTSSTEWQEFQESELYRRMQDLRGEVQQTIDTRTTGMLGMLEQVFQNNSHSKEAFAGNIMMAGMNPEFEGVDFTRYFFESPYAEAIEDFITSHPDYLKKYIENDLSFVLGCAAGEAGDKMMGLQKNLREAYLDSERLKVRANIENYLLEGGVSPNQLKEVLNNGVFDKLIQDLENGDCNVSNIARIAEFNNRHFPEHDLVIDSETATQILGSTISLRKTENELQFANLRDRISQSTGLNFDEIQAIFDIADFQERNDALNGLLSQIPEAERESLRAEMNEVFEIREDIETQKRTFDDVVANVQMIYQMSDTERAEYRRLLMSLTGSSIHIDISREVHRNYILNDPAHRLILLESAEDIVDLLPNIDRRDIDVSDINPDFLTHPDILRFISQGDFRQVDFFKLPSEVFQSQELCTILGENKPDAWNTLFYNILLTHGAENSVSFLHDLIFNNPEVFRGEDTIEHLHKAIPRSVRDSDTDDILSEIPIFEPNITSTEQFNERVASYISYFTHPEENSGLWNTVGVGDRVSPIPQEATIDTGEGQESLQSIDRESFQEYIRNYGISPEIYTSIRALIEAGRIVDIPFIFSGLNPENSEELELILFALDTYDEHYHFLSRRAQRNPQVLQKLGESGISTFTPTIIANITSEKLLARYLIGYQASGDNIEAIYENDKFPLLKRFLENTNLEDLLEEEKDVLQSFLDGMGESISEISQAVEQINIENTEIEELTGQIRDILSEYTSESDVEMILELLSINDLDNFFRRLDAVLTNNGIGLEERRGIRNQILDLISQNRQRESESVDQVSRDASGLSQQERRELEENPYFENNEFNIELILTNFQSFAQENLEQADLEQMGDREFIIRYLQSLGLPNSVLERKQEEFIHSIQAQTEEIQASILQELAKNNPEEFERLIELGVGTHTQRQVYERMYSGEINFSSPKINSSINVQSSSLPENWTTSDLSRDFQARIREDGGTMYLISGDQEIPMSRTDVSIIHNNPEAERNFVSTYDAMRRSGLEGLWDRRQNIFRGIANVRGLSFNIHDDYIGKNELKILFDSILTSVDEEPLKNSAYTIDEIVAEIERRNGTNITGQESEVNRYGDTRIESAFIQRYMPRGELYFHQNAFEQSLKT